MKTVFKKLEYYFSAESTGTEKATFPYKIALSEAKAKNLIRCLNVPHGCLAEPNALLYDIVIAYFMVLETMCHRLSFRAENIGYTRPCGLGYKQWIY